MQQRLALTTPAMEIARFTMLFHLCDMPANGAPTANLSQITLTAAAAIISAIPLEPAPWIVWMNPTFALPLQQWL